MAPPAALSASEQRRRAEEATVRTWRLLCGRFELPPDCREHHACEWTLLDTGLAGCRVCGSVHSCADHTCRRVATEDSEVCDITGLCVRNRNFVETSFSDNVIVECEGQSCSDRVREHLGCVDEVVQQALTSRLARSCHDAEMQRVCARVRARTNEFLRPALRSTRPLNLCDAVESVASSLPHAATHAFDLALRTRIARLCALNITRALSVSLTTFGLQMREHEVPWFTLGLLYLMRRGVFLGKTCALPHEPLLQSLLPSENMICRLMDISTKCITDSENRFKYVLRQCPAGSVRAFDRLFAHE